MENLNDVKSIWRSVKMDSLPNSDEVKGIVRKYRNQKLAKKAGIILFGAGIFCVLVFVLISHMLGSLVARIGDVFILVSCLGLIMANGRSIGRLYRLDYLSNKEYLHYLERRQEGYIRFYKTNQVISLAFNSVGLLLYLFEFGHMSFTRSLICYGLSSLYLLLIWLLVRPWSFKMKMRKFNNEKVKFEKIAGQL